MFYDALGFERSSMAIEHMASTVDPVPCHGPCFMIYETCSIWLQNMLYDS